MATDSRITARKTARKDVNKARAELEKAMRTFRNTEWKYYQAILDNIPTSPDKAMSAHQIALRLSNDERTVAEITGVITTSYVARRDNPNCHTVCHETFNGLKKSRELTKRRWAEVDENGNVIGPVHTTERVKNCYYIEK